jgi:hypothetical protein
MANMLGRGMTIPFMIIGALVFGCFVIGPIFLVCILPLFAISTILAYEAHLFEPTDLDPIGTHQNSVETDQNPS